jgi:hypothetical protein
MHVNEIRISHFSRWIDQPIIHSSLLAVCYWLFDITRINILCVYERYMSIYIQSQVFAKLATILMHAQFANRLFGADMGQAPLTIYVMSTHNFNRLCRTVC